jgi:NADH-quinone oxidoreductase subunit E
MAYIRVLEIATFYTMFQLEPVGKKAHVQVCGTTPCMLRGSKDLIEVCKHRIHHDPFHVSADGNFSWEEVECLGACVNAPMVMIWKDTYEDLTADSLNRILDGFETGNPPKPGPQIERQFAAPVSGLTSLQSDAKSTTSPAPTKEPALADAEPKKQTESANVRERPAPKAPMRDATAKKPPKGDKS